jgi:hypothetical protein
LQDAWATAAFASKLACASGFALGLTVFGRGLRAVLSRELHLLPLTRQVRVVLLATTICSLAFFVPRVDAPRRCDVLAF